MGPREIRTWLFKLVPTDVAAGADLTVNPPLDLGDVRIDGPLERSQESLGEVVSKVLVQGGVPIILGGGHETAFGHYLGYAANRTAVGIINVDAHLDVRPLCDGRGTSGTPFRQAMEHAPFALPGQNYVCLGARPQAISRDHWEYARARGCVVRFDTDLREGLEESLQKECGRLSRLGCRVMVTIDADAIRMADMPAVSAPAPTGLAGIAVAGLARRAGVEPAVASLDIVEISPRLDRDSQGARLGALIVWNFLIGLSMRENAET
jgi:formiminoglutamase